MTGLMLEIDGLIVVLGELMVKDYEELMVSRTENPMVDERIQKNLTQTRNKVLLEADI